MANAFAAMAMTPRGATMMVMAICAPQMTACSRVMGAEMRSALRRTVWRGR